MREIKFRAWDNQARVMVVASSKKMLVIDKTNSLSSTALINGYELMQYTGLKDKDGVEIYEGDLIKNGWGRTAKVVWHEFTAGFDCDFVSDSGDHYNIDMSRGFKTCDWSRHVQVIGNIYENPELLESNNE